MSTPPDAMDTVTVSVTSPWAPAPARRSVLDVLLPAAALAPWTLLTFAWVLRPSSARTPAALLWTASYATLSAVAGMAVLLVWDAIRPLSPRSRLTVTVTTLLTWLGWIVLKQRDAWPLAIRSYEDDRIPTRAPIASLRVRPREPVLTVPTPPPPARPTPRSAGAPPAAPGPAPAPPTPRP